VGDDVKATVLWDPEWEDSLRDSDATVDATFVPVANALLATGTALWRSSLYMSPRSQRQSEWMGNPRLGDLVIVHLARGAGIDRVGTWIGSWTYVHPPDDCGPSDMPFRERAREEVYHLATLDRRAMKWGNCQLLRIPRDATEDPGKDPT
jgi:hypothetical protein